MTDHKACTKCGAVKPLDGFHRDKRSRDGHISQCKECALERARQWRESSPEGTAYQANYYRLNSERLKAQSRAWRAANPGRQRERRGEHPESQWEWFYRDRARRYGFVPVVESFTRAELIARYGDVCAHCGGPFEHLDHFPVPVALGGAHSLNNCRPSCKACNLSQARAIQLAATR